MSIPNQALITVSSLVVSRALNTKKQLERLAKFTGRYVLEGNSTSQFWI